MAAGQTATQGATRATNQAASPAAARQTIEIRNVDLHLSDQVLLRVRELRGEVTATKPEQPATLDDPQSFRIRVTSGVVAMTGDDLASLLNGVVFAYPGAPLRDIRVRTDSVQLIQTGTLHMGVNLKFRIRANVDVTPDGHIRIHPTLVRVLGLNGQKALHLVGMHLSDVLNLRHARGLTAHGDDLLLDPTAVLPPPAVDGRLVSVRIEGNALVEEFARAPSDTAHAAASAAASPDSSHAGFVHYLGGRLQFGRLLMSNTDLRIVSTDPHGSFDLNLPHYAEQLVAGYSRTRPNMGLTAYMPNYATLHGAPSAARPSTGPATGRATGQNAGQSSGQGARP